MDTSELRPLVEALIFASEEPLRAEKIAELLEADKSPVHEVISLLLAEYGSAGRGFVLAEVAGGYQFRTRPEHGDWIRRLGRTKPFRFSRAAPAPPATAPHRQPAPRAASAPPRGVDSGGVLKTLLEKQLLRILGRKDVPGKPMMYGTSREFLELFGLRDLTELPSLKEFSELSVELPDGE